VTISTGLTEALRDLPPEYRDEERLGIFRSLVAPGVPDDVVALVYHYAADLGLDPLRKEVMAIQSKRKDDLGQWVTDYNIIVNVHGIVKLMGREKDYAGLRAACVYADERCLISADGAVDHTFDVAKRMTGTDPRTVLPIGAWATVTRMMHGEPRLFTQFVPFHQVAQTTDEYVEGKKTGRRMLRSVWAQRPDWMCEKCAIAAVARKSYDHKLGRIYAPEEFGAVSDPSGAIEADAELLDAKVDTLPARIETGARVKVEGVQMPRLVAPAFMQQHQAEVSAHIAEGHSKQKAEAMAHDMRVMEIEKAIEATERLFTDPERKFLVRTSSGIWVKDAELLAKVNSPAPILLDAAGVGRLAGIMDAIEVIRTTKEANGGR